MSYAEKTLKCKDCGMDFIFTSGEQEFYAQKGFTNEPTRCPECRQQRKVTNDRRGGYSDRGGYGRESAARGTREMHSATCATCGKEALVPFVPRGDKPVYCSTCFQEQRASTAPRW